MIPPPHRALPEIATPSGGGHLRGIGETFAMAAATGTASLSIPLPMSRARGLEPATMLRYDSGSGQGPFGLGWSVDVPQIRRRTERGVPRYDDSDVFVMGGDELVAVGDHERDGFAVRTFRPRRELVHTRIERWTRGDDCRWRTLSADGITTWLGTSSQSRIAEGARIYAWLADGQWDQRGNAIRWAWIEEGTNRYLRRVCYGNRTPHAVGEVDDDWLYELVFDYGEEHLVALDGRDRRIDASPVPRRPWTMRSDPFSVRRAGFEVRTSRLCRQALLFHRIPEHLGRAATLVSALAFHYDETPVATTLVAAEPLGFVDRDGSYLAASGATLELAYRMPRIDPVLRQATIEGIPAGTSHAALVDLDGEGVPGLLVETDQAWWYRRGNGPDAVEEPFGPPERIAAPLLAGARLIDLDGDGRLELASLRPPCGSFARDEAGWSAFRPLRAPALDGEARLVDLTGDGLPDLLTSTPSGFVWYRNLGLDGFAAAELGDGPRVLDASASELVAFADMTGDGLVDLVRVRNGDIVYWPSLGHGRFGSPIAMSGAPWLDAPERFDPRRVRLADLDGSGPTDLVYCGRDGVSVHRNAAGNGWLAPDVLPVAGFDDTTTVSVTDLFGRGTACLVWSSPLPLGRKLAWVDLMPDGKPWLMTSIANGLGGETLLHHAPSTRFSVADRLAGRPWRTRLPYPVHVVERVETLDHITGDRYTHRYAYHQGCHDGVEREFAGFAMVEQWDRADHEQIEMFHAPPSMVRTWFHVGVAIDDLPGSVHGLDAIAAADLREALHALRGMPLQSEVYGEDGTPLADRPYAITTNELSVVMLAPHVFTPRTRSVRHEESERGDHARVTCKMTVEHDAWGNPLRELSIAYGRDVVDLDPRLVEHDRNAQRKSWLVETVSRYTNPIDLPDVRRSPELAETIVWEITGAIDGQPGVDEVVALAQSATTVLPAFDVDAALSPMTPRARRMMSRLRQRYRPDDLDGLLPLGVLEPRALLGRVEELAFTPDHLAALGLPFDAATAGYLTDGDGAWRVSSTVGYTEGEASPAEELAAAQSRFFIPCRSRDPFGADTVVRFDALALLPVETIDALGNRIVAENDYRVLAPVAVTDANRNRTTVAYDALGRVAAIAIGGKVGEHVGDTLDGAPVELDAAMVAGFFADPAARAAGLLGAATTRTIVDLGRASRESRANWAATITREDGDILGIEVAYVDGLGRPLQARRRLDDGRWHVTGWKILDRKGEPVRAYEPMFAAEHVEALDTIRGVAVTTLRDPLGRIVGVLHPDHTWTRVVHDPWKVEHWDACDTLSLDPLADHVVGPQLGALPTTDVLPSWRDQRIAGEHGDDGVRAAELSMSHAGTPSVSVLDALGRTRAEIAHQRRDGVDTWPTTRTAADVAGNPRRTWDAADRVVLEQTHDLLGRTLRGRSVDAGESAQLHAADGVVLVERTARGHRIRREYDRLRRPTQIFVDDGAGERLVERIEYGEALGDAANHRGRVHRSFDGAGIFRTHGYDHRGRAVLVGRRLLRDPSLEVDWRAEPALDDEELVEVSRHDDADRVVERVVADGTTLRYRYDRDGHVVRVAAEDREFLAEAEYDAQGRCVRARHGNGVVRTFAYDAVSQRLSRLVTTRGGNVLQDASYHYDAVGNIVAIRDAAQPAVYFRNAVVTADLEYTYDALSQLVEVAGREHAGATPTFDGGVTGGAHPHDGAALRRYVERYDYGVTGNLLRLEHHAGGTGFVRELSYDAAGDRLRAVATGGTTSEVGHDAAGHMTSIAHLSSMQWDPRGRLVAVARTAGDGADRCRYAYDGASERVRKTRFRPNGGTRRDERIYLGGCERYREYAADGVTVTLERFTLEVEEAGRPIAHVERRTRGDDGSPAQLDRYAYGNHLGSSAIELDGDGAVLSFEEYYAFGGTSFQSARDRVPAKRRRFLGKERDDETGFYAIGVRYYAPWLARWISCDPAGLANGSNLYLYCSNNPVRLVDRNGRDDEGFWAVLAGYNKGVTDIQIELGKQAVLMSPLGQIGEAAYHSYQQAVGEEPPPNPIVAAAGAFGPGAQIAAGVVVESVRDPERAWIVASEAAVSQLSFERAGTQLMQLEQAVGRGDTKGMAESATKVGLYITLDGAQIVAGHAGRTGPKAPKLPAASKPPPAAPAIQKPKPPTPPNDSVGAARAGDPEIAPGKWVNRARGGSEGSMRALERQAEWSQARTGYEHSYTPKGAIVLREYQIGKIDFDDVKFDPDGNLQSLDEFKAPYDGPIAAGSWKAVRRLRKQADAQLEVADEFGVPLKWHVPTAQLENFKNALGKARSKAIEWVPY